jgi:hypothetical protein
LVGKRHCRTCHTPPHHITPFSIFTPRDQRVCEDGYRIFHKGKN